MKVVKGLAKELKWLKKEQRACHFFLFHLITDFSAQAKQGIALQVKDCSDLSEQQYWIQSLLSQSDGPLQQAEAGELPPPPELPEVLIPQLGNYPGIENAHEEIMHPENSSIVNINFIDGKKVGDSKISNNLPPVDLIHAHGVSNTYSKNSKNIQDSFLSVIDQLHIRYITNNQILKLISKITALWAEQYNRFPSPFSWLNDKNKDHCQWLWDEMHKRCIGIPFQPRNQTQRWTFIIATFDNWKGWTIPQEEYLTKKNPKRKPGKLLSGGLDPGNKEIGHKMILLEELKNAWEQKERRARRAKEPAAAKLTKAAQKKLEFIAHLEKSTSKDILNDLINNAFNDAKSKSRQS
ncbi:hypothetical protein [Serratia marcescens]|uniref:Transposase n=1 Tax=Serratia marcescens TaxID=615 RepID=A0A9X8YNA6_SERMA|nr:hypothetical protein [Serratia marcescens]MBS3894668.1 hypothetical protein [Serratia marcescens]